MKTRLLLFLVLLTVVALQTSASDLAITVSIDWQMSVQAGIEYRFTDYVGIKADLGLSIMGLLVADLYAVVHLLPPDDPWRLQILIGVPNVAVPLVFSAGMVSFGGAVGFGRALSDTLGLDLYVGTGFPLFFEEGTEMIRDIQFPLDLWPEFALSMRFGL